MCNSNHDMYQLKMQALARQFFTFSNSLKVLSTGNIARIWRTGIFVPADKQTDTEKLLTVFLANVIIAQRVKQHFDQREWTFFRCENREKERKTIYTHKLKLEMLN